MSSTLASSSRTPITRHPLPPIPQVTARSTSVPLPRIPRKRDSSHSKRDSSHSKRRIAKFKRPSSSKSNATTASERDFDTVSWFNNPLLLPPSPVTANTTDAIIEVEQEQGKQWSRCPRRPTGPRPGPRPLDSMVASQEAKLLLSHSLRRVASGKSKRPRTPKGGASTKSPAAPPSTPTSFATALSPGTTPSSSNAATPLSPLSPTTPTTPTVPSVSIQKARVRKVAKLTRTLGAAVPLAMVFKDLREVEGHPISLESTLKEQQPRRKDSQDSEELDEKDSSVVPSVQFLDGANSLLLRPGSYDLCPHRMAVTLIARIQRVRARAKARARAQPPTPRASWEPSPISPASATRRGVPAPVVLREVKGQRSEETNPEVILAALRNMGM